MKNAKLFHVRFYFALCTLHFDFKFMFIAKVIGNVWATRKHAGLENSTLLIVKAVDISTPGKLTGEATLAIDGNQGAGPGDTVLVVDEGGSARKILKNSKAPVRTVVAGIVDKVYQGKEKNGL